MVAVAAQVGAQFSRDDLKWDSNRLQKLSLPFAREHIKDDAGDKGGMPKRRKAASRSRSVPLPPFRTAQKNTGNDQLINSFSTRRNPRRLELPAHWPPSSGNAVRNSKGFKGHSTVTGHRSESMHGHTDTVTDSHKLVTHAQATVVGIPCDACPCVRCTRCCT